MSEIEKIAKQMVTKGKGILAADESNGTMTKRLSSVNVESTPENRLKFRETLFSAEGMKNYIGGVILYDETIKQKGLFVLWFRHKVLHHQYNFSYLLRKIKFL